MGELNENNYTTHTSVYFGNPSLTALSIASCLNWGVRINAWLPLASIALQPSQPLSCIPNLSNTRGSILPEAKYYITSLKIISSKRYIQFFLQSWLLYLIGLSQPFFFQLSTYRGSGQLFQGLKSIHSAGHIRPPRPGCDHPNSISLLHSSQ